jgi:hypothetical protein
MAEKDTRPQATADKQISESTATDSKGKLKAGYAYKYVTERGENGERITRKVYSKVGQ